MNRVGMPSTSLDIRWFTCLVRRFAVYYERATSLDKEVLSDGKSGSRG